MTDSLDLQTTLLHHPDTGRELQRLWAAVEALGGKQPSVSIAVEGDAQPYDQGLIHRSLTLALTQVEGLASATDTTDNTALESLFHALLVPLVTMIDREIEGLERNRDRWLYQPDWNTVTLAETLVQALKDME